MALTRHANSVILFLVVLVLAGAIFYFRNEAAHRETKLAVYKACVADRQIAQNQRRVLLALISIEQEEARRGVDGRELPELQLALAQVPSFDCVR